MQYHNVKWKFNVVVFFWPFSPNFTIFFYQKIPVFSNDAMIFFYCQEKKETKKKGGDKYGLVRWINGMACSLVRIKYIIIWWESLKVFLIRFKFNVILKSYFSFTINVVEYIVYLLYNVWNWN